jgi:3-oxoacyl-[acyl-carrier-protein] synthase-3
MVDTGRTPLYCVGVAGTGSYVPSTRLDSDELDRRLGLPPGTVEAASGVRSRYVAGSETLVDVAAAAARKAMHAAGCGVEDVDCVLFASAVPHQPIPTTSVLLKEALGFGDLPAPAFDVDATCLGFLAAVDVASALIACGRYERILVVAADLPSRGLDWSDVKVAGIFGDGAGAMVLQKAASPAAGILSLRMETHTEGAASCVLRAGGTGIDPHTELAEFMRGTRFEMNGTAAYRVAADHLPRMMREALALAGVTLDDIAIAIPHQASATALALMERRLGLTGGKMLNIFADHGNQVSASLPTAIDWARRHDLVGEGSLMLLLGSAAGITLAASVWRL